MKRSTPFPAQLSVVMISLNEAHNMEGVLLNLKGWAQQVFLVDSYSADATVDIALKHGVHVVQRRFRGFGDQWNFAMTHLPISTPWTMKLDPDERLTDSLKNEIRTAMAEDHIDAISFQRRLWFMTRPLPVRQSVLRVWRTGRCTFTDARVNEQPMIEGRIVHVKGDLEHHDSPDLEHWLDKQNRYTSAEAVSTREQHQTSVDARLFGNALQRRMWVKQHFNKIPLRYHLLFLYHYVVMGAWRAGWVGYAWSRMRCDVYRLWEYKLREMRISGRLPRKRPDGRGVPDVRVKQF